MQYYVYILESEKDGRYYIGQTQNPDERIRYHNTGRSGYTRKFMPWRIKYSAVCSSRSEAMRLEKKLKAMKSREDLVNYAIIHSFTAY